MRNQVKSCVPIVALIATLCSCACDGRAPWTPTAATWAPVGQPPAPEILVEIYPGEPVSDPDYCFARCPPDVVVKAGADGHYLLRAAEPYTLSLIVLAAGHATELSGEISFDWSGDVTRFGTSITPGAYAYGMAAGFQTPSSRGTGFLTVSMKAGDVMGSTRIPVHVTP